MTKSMTRVDKTPLCNGHGAYKRIVKKPSVWVILHIESPLVSDNSAASDEGVALNWVRTPNSEKKDDPGNRI